MRRVGAHRHAPATSCQVIATVSRKYRDENKNDNNIFIPSIAFFPPAHLFSDTHFREKFISNGVKRMFIVFEGIDNAGKTYQIGVVRSILREEGYRVSVHKEFFSKIREILKRQMLKGKLPSFVNVIYDNVMAAVGNDNGSGEDDGIVMIDRFIHTVLAYGKTEKENIDWLRSLNRKDLYDLGIFIDITPEEALNRSEKDNDDMSYSWDYLNNARENYLKFVENGELVMVDGMRDRVEVTGEIIQLIRDRLSSE